jgi:hypothetical protein
MDRATNPFVPGAGTRPPELAGRDRIIEEAEVALARFKAGRQARSQMLLGLRGVGKTVLLNRIEEIAEEKHGYLTVFLEAPEGRSIAEMLVPPLRRVLFKLSAGERAQVRARKALDALRGFASAFKVAYGGVEVGVEPPSGIADSGNLEADLPEFLLEVALTAKEAGRAVALLIDEVQYLSEPDLAALIVSIHKIGQKSLPLVVFGAGLPQLAALAGDAKSYAERLFAYPGVGPLAEEDAAEAIREPILREGVQIEDEALEEIVKQTQGYPYFLQEWGSHVWNTAAASPISVQDARKASVSALEELDRGFFRVRMDRLTPRERDYMSAMAQLGPGPHRSGDIAKLLGESVTSLGPVRNGLIKKGMVYSPAFGDTAFTVPMFDEFMRRAMPDWSPEAAQARKGKKGKK